MEYDTYDEVEYPEWDDDEYVDEDYEYDTRDADLTYPERYDREIEWAHTLAQIEDHYREMAGVAETTTDLDSRYWTGYDEAMSYVQAIIDHQEAPF